MSSKTASAQPTHPDVPRDAAHACCQAMEALAKAACAIHCEGCCAEECCDADCCDCCKQSLEYVLKAIECHVACMRGACHTRYAVKAGEKG